uniref:Coiled-coil domain-containing protein 25 n=1 Tax=Parascaris equorum TaxID=6256 RepID=A0A914R851_PAREQ
MVIRFTLNVVDPPVVLDMGVDKYGNEDLIRWGWPEDVWFHVDKVSSAHVYVRLPQGQTIDDMSEALVDDCAQLVKANSIQVSISAALSQWFKRFEMSMFYGRRFLEAVRVAKRINEIVNRLIKTERREEIDYRGEREERDAKERQKAKEKQREEKAREQLELEEKERQRQIRSYDGVFTEDKMHSNYDGGNGSDDFM